jgi:glycogen operon protein
LRGLDNICYYHTDPANPGKYRDYTGCGNSVDVSHPRSLRLIMDSLRYWVQEMHVDGFRFDLAVELGRRAENYDRRATFFQALHQDPVLGPTKLIAEPWDLGPGGYQIGNFPTDWAELNGKFRDGVRRFWRGDPGVSGEFAARITGSEDVFSHNRRTPQASVNFICSHDGFTLADLVSYNQKHNLDNGEKNADGDSHNISYNHGVEGETDDVAIKRVRHRQIRNFLTTLICSQGVPFLLGGDERLRTQKGNNNSYCQDNELGWISWDDSPEAAELRGFVTRLLKFRRETSALLRGTFFTGEESDQGGLADVSWLRPDGGAQRQIDWEVGKPGAFAMLLSRTADHPALLFFFNARHEATRFRFPATPVCRWNLVLETGDPHRQQGGARAETTIQLVDRSLQIWQEEA